MALVQGSWSGSEDYGQLRAMISPRLAVGDLSGLSGDQRRAFTGTRHFRRLGAVGQGLRRGEEPEPGQTVAEFLLFGAPRPSPDRRTLVLRPMGPFPIVGSPDPEVLRRYTEVFFQLPVVVRAGPDRLDPSIGARLSPQVGGRQIHARSVLRALRRDLRPHEFAAVAVTPTDLYPGDGWDHVFGLASLRHRVGVFSFARLDPHPAGRHRNLRRRRGLRWRSLNVLTHETGHMFGLRHCVYYQCNMNGSLTLSQSDHSPLRLCPVCLRKLQLAIGFDVRVRYQALLRFYAKYGLWRNERWVSRRLAYIRGRLPSRLFPRLGRLPAGGEPRARLD